MSIRSTQWLPLLTACVAGCGGESGPLPVHPVSGQVTFNGKPLAGAQVVFVPTHPEKVSVRPTGRTDQDGRFELTSFVARDGAPEGTYAVIVDWRRMTPGPGGEAVAGPNLIPPRFSEEQKTELRVQIQRGANELTPFQLVSR
jgi:hypothetical protein